MQLSISTIRNILRYCTWSQSLLILHTLKYYPNNVRDIKWDNFCHNSPHDELWVIEMCPHMNPSLYLYHLQLITWWVVPKIMSIYAFLALLLLSIMELSRGLMCKSHQPICFFFFFFSISNCIFNLYCLGILLLVILLE